MRKTFFKVQNYLALSAAISLRLIELVGSLLVFEAKIVEAYV